MVEVVLVTTMFVFKYTPDIQWKPLQMKYIRYIRDCDMNQLYAKICTKVNQNQFDAFDILLTVAIVFVFRFDTTYVYSNNLFCFSFFANIWTVF